jgi:tRNA (adenine22-N1)-methyltransferase
MTAALVPPGLAVADIGSDHAYLPAHLVRLGLCPRAIASDIAGGPLENARQTVLRAKLQDRIELRLSDGFQAFAPADAACWVLAGMGGTLMARLLDAAPWLRAPGTVLVAQPMRHADDLRAWLTAHGFRIETELACRDAGRPYLALRAVYDGTARDYPPGYIHYGELIHHPGPAARDLLARELNLLETTVNCQLSPDNTEPTVLLQKEALDDFRSRYL